MYKTKKQRKLTRVPKPSRALIVLGLVYTDDFFHRLVTCLIGAGPGHGRHRVQQRGPSGKILRGSGPSSESFRGNGPPGESPWGSGPPGISLRESGPSGKSLRGIGPSGVSLRGNKPSGESYRGSGPSGVSLRDSGPSGVSLRDSGPSGVSLRDSGPTGVSLRDSGPSGVCLRDSGPSGKSLRGSGPSDDSLRSGLCKFSGRAMLISRHDITPSTRVMAANNPLLIWTKSIAPHAEEGAVGVCRAGAEGQSRTEGSEKGPRPKSV